MSKVGVYGKVASQADFLRVNAGAFAQAGLDRWIAEGLEMIRAERTALPAGPISFLIAAPGAPALIGAFAPAADAAGRASVLAVFVELVREGLADRLSSLPATYAYFINAAGALAGSSATHDGAAIAAGAQQLESILPDEGPGGADGLAGETVSSLIEAMGGGQPALAYACRTLVAACDQAAKAGEGRGGITVDAPAPSPMAQQLWLAIARERLGWRDSVPALMWTDGPDGRLLMTLGPPAGSALAFLANPRHRSNRFWPMRTDVATAVQEAVGALSAQQRAVTGDPGASLAELAAAFAR
ncbi:type VI secretion system-associated protein TagF [Dyella sp.]|jgi:type VI secretion system ImpM family protein|uniref:type VI secretion system-associated protein TagF n=1 Tax=Dyella sp. TaxID=1869338 RepID=UPI002D79C247|nr:type VI secretion system-associated protein TagF [Dyella sp.]HET6432032.1 type VI secretion system-associated protein TagF [Dyella sp.]